MATPLNKLLGDSLLGKGGPVATESALKGWSPESGGVRSSFGNDAIRVCEVETDSRLEEWLRTTDEAVTPSSNSGLTIA